MNEDEFDVNFDQDFNIDFEYIIDSSELKQIFDEVAAKVPTFESIEELQQYINSKVEKLLSYDKSKVFDILLENLSRDFLQKYVKEIVKIVDSKKYPKLLGISEDGKIDLEILGKNLLRVAEGIKEKNEHTFQSDIELLDILKLLPESFIKENGLMCFEAFSGECYEELKTKIFKDIKSEDYEKIREIISWLGENAIDRLGYNFKKDNLFDSIIVSLPSEFVKDNVELLIKAISQNQVQDLYDKAFETIENEPIDDEKIEKNISIFVENIKSTNQYMHNISSQERRIIDILPNRYIRQNIEQCFSIFEKDTYPNLLIKCFDYKETETIDEEEIKNVLKQIKGLIDAKYNINNFFDKFDIDKCWENAIAKIPQEFIEKNPEYIIELLGKNIPDESKKRFLEILPEKVIRDNEDKLELKVNSKNVQSCRRYFKYLLSDDGKTLLKSDFGSKIFNFINYSNSTDIDFVEMKKSLEELKNNILVPDMNKYSEYLPEDYSKELPSMDIDTFGNFVNDLESLKILNGYIPEEYCDYIIKQKLSKDSILNQNLNTYLPILKRAFEDKLHYMLSKEGIEGYTIEFFEKKGNTLGYHNKSEKIIGFLDENLINLNESDSHIINTAYHEVRHAIQAKHYYTTDFSLLDGTRYNMIKEEIIRDDENAFYERNYTRMYCEIDARLAGTRGQAEYLKYLGIPEEEIIESVGNTQISLRESVEKNKAEENYNIEYASNKVDRDGRIVSISQKALELIMKKPNWVEKYPVLSLEFDENGERKKTPEILSSAMACGNESVRDIYMKILGIEVQVGLDEAAATLEYISKLLETRQGYYDDIIELVNLVIKNETISSLRDKDIDDIECKRVLSLLNKIAQDNPNLDISKYINETINKFFDEGKIEVEIKKDKNLSNSAISTILERDVKTKEEFEEIFNALSKVMIKDEKSNWELQYGFKQLFTKYFKNDPTIDFNELLRETLEFVPEDNRIDVINNSWNAVPEELKPQHLKGFLDLSSKYRKVDIEFIIQTVSKINKKEFDANEILLKEAVSQYMPEEINNFVKVPKSKEELERAIKEAQIEGAETKDLETVIRVSMIESLRANNPESVEMLYSQVDFLEGERRKGSAISTFFIYANEKLKKEHTESVLRHLLLEKEYFSSENVAEIFEEIKIFIGEEFLKEESDLSLTIEEIGKEALEKAKIRDEMLAEQKRLEEEEKRKIKSLTDLDEKLNALKVKYKENWKLSIAIEDLMKYNMDENAKVEKFVMLDSVLKMFSDEYMQQDILGSFWNLIPDDKKMENIQGFIETRSKYKTIDFGFAYRFIEESEENPEFLERAFGNYLSPGLILFLKKPKTDVELRQIISEAKEVGTDGRELLSAIEMVTNDEASKGNPESAEMLYTQLEHINSNLWKGNAISTFFIYASNELKIQKTEEILRHTLIENGNIDEKTILNIIESVKGHIGTEFLDKNPNLLASIDGIQTEVLEKKEPKLEIQEIITDSSVSYERKGQVNDFETPSEQLLALQKISNEVQTTDISMGKKMIKAFLAKAKGITNKIGMFFGGGDDHEDR